MTGVEWADEYFYLPEGSSHIAGRWKTQPVQVAMLNMMTNDAIKMVSVRKSARLGYTKVLVAALLYMTEHKKRSSVVYQPIDDESDGFVSDEIDPAIAEMEVIQAVFPDWNKNNERNNISRKQTTNAVIDFRGASSPGNFRRLTKQAVFGDEVDAWPLEVSKNGKGEGSPVDLALVRIKGSAYPKAVFGSTPTITGKSHIENLENKADLVFRFYLPCPECEFKQPLVFGFEGMEYGLKWDDEQPTNEKKGRSAYYQCCNCPRKIYYQELEAMEAKGKWVAEDLTWTKDGIHFYDFENVAVRAPKHAAIVVSAIYSLNLDGWSDIVDEWLKAKGDSLKEKSFYNTVLGELWNETVSEVLEHDRLLEKVAAYPAQVPGRVVYLTAGIDSQLNRYEVYVWGWAPGEEAFLIDKAIIMGRPDDEDTLTRVDAYINRRFMHEDGEEMTISKICWDTGGIDPAIVHKRSRMHGTFRLLPVKGSSTYGKTVISMPRNRNEHGTYLCEIGTDTAKELLYARMGAAAAPFSEPTPFGIRFPADEEIFGEKEAKQLVAEVLVETHKGGKIKRLWDSRGRRNEALDCFVYAYAALRISMQKFQLNLDELAASRTGKKEKVDMSAIYAALGGGGE